MIMEQALKNVPLFANLSEKEFKLLSSTGSVKKFDRTEIIIHKADVGDTFFSILSGKVKVVLTDEEGKEFIVGILKQLEFFGELSLLDGEPRSASVVALEPTEVLVLKRDDFLRQLSHNPDLCIKIIGVLGSRLRKANHQIENLVFLDVCGRLARMLLDMAESQGVKQSEQGIVIEVDFSRTELANIVGTTRETLTRALKTLENMGYIAIKKNRLTITDEAGLRRRMY